MMRKALPRIGLAGALILTTLFVGCCVNIGGNYRAKAERTEDQAVSATDMTALQVTTNVGTLKLTAGDTPDVHISAKITVKSKTVEEAEALIDEVRIVAEPDGQKLVVKAMKPSGFGRNQLAVDFTITAPAALALQCTTNVGDVRVAGFNENVTARTDVGTITCSDLRRAVDLHTNVGDIRASYTSEASPALRAALSTNVGNVEFDGPTNISARLEARVNVGSIDTDRPLRVTGKIEKSVRAMLGEAEGEILLTTNVGSIKIR